MRAPMSRNVRAIKIMDKKNCKGRKDADERRGRKMTPAEFTRHLERVNDNSSYEGIRMRWFRVEEYMRGRIGKAIREAP